MDGSPTAAVDYGSEEAAMQAYLRAGEKRAYALGNRGPIRFAASGELHPDIVEAYWRCGFYVFEGVLKPDELADIERDLHDILDRLPVEKGAAVDRKGRPALAADCTAPTLYWAKPLADPFGGTSIANGRHPVKMYEPTPAADAPKEVVYLILGSLQFSDAALRVYGHPQLLAVAAAINGPDFTPFNEALWIKEPGRAPRLPGIRTAQPIGTIPSGTRASTASTSWASSMAAPPPTASGWCRARTSAAESTSRPRPPRPGPSGWPMPCPSSARRAMSR
jgi:hypothetical protein